MWEDVLTEFAKFDEIDFAYPTIRRFIATEEGKTLLKKNRIPEDDM